MFWSYPEVLVILGFIDGRHRRDDVVIKRIILKFQLIVRHFYSCLVAAGVACSVCMPLSAKIIGGNDIIPRPLEVTVSEGTFVIPSSGLKYNLSGGEMLADYLKGCKEFVSPVSSGNEAEILIRIGEGSGEGYVITVTPEMIVVDSPSEAGAFYAVQSLLQMMRMSEASEIACGVVSDSPRFPYRGMHFDVSRHFRPVDFLKKQIDAMALLKLNNMHLHLTDAAGWRMKIDAYPRLTEYAAWRPQARWQDWTDKGESYCEEGSPGAYGGYYTKEELRDLVKYAAERHIRVIPEFEIPGHSKEVVSAYPEFSCSGIPGTDGDMCLGKEATFRFIETVLDEIMDVFPSELIHIGGDEASKAAWHTCPDCKSRMESEGLKSVDELQSYGIHRVEDYVNSKGRSIIGWDEIIDGGLAPNATVMSWRGTKGGVEAINTGHDAIMTPASHCYLDYCQDAPFKEPVSFGEYVPLEKVYGLEPMEESIDPSMASHLLGVQANLWCEYVLDDDHAEHMYYPRTYAIAEVGWSSPDKDFPDFRRRAVALNELMESAGYHPFDLNTEYGDRRETKTPVSHLAMKGKVDYITPAHEKYPGTGDNTLIDGVRGGWAYANPRWQGFLGDFEAVVDLGEVMPLHSISTDCMQSSGAWIHLPQYVEYFISEDGKEYTPVETVWTDIDPYYNKTLVKDYTVTLPSLPARFVKIKAKLIDREGAWIFVDEIVVN